MRRAEAALRPGPSSRQVALTFRWHRMTVRRDDGGLLNARQNAIIGVGTQGSHRALRLRAHGRQPRRQYLTQAGTKVPGADCNRLIRYRLRYHLWARVYRDYRGLNDTVTEQEARDDPPRDRPELFALHHHILEESASASCNERTTSAPSPTADATRFVEPLRTSPMAKTSGRVVSRSNAWPPLPSRCSVKLG
jgi:hypothetical protein